MATNEQALDQPPALETKLDEASIISSLARLQEMHILLRNLRETIPKVMDSILLDPTSPDQLHSNFSLVANGAAQAIKHFTQFVEDDKTKEVMEKAKESRTENSEGITAWQVTEHEDWLNVNQEDGNEDNDKEDEGIADAGDGSSVKYVHETLDMFRSTHVNVEVSLDEESRTVTLCLPLPARINFHIQLNTTPEGHNTYDVDTKSGSKLQKAILEVIRARNKPNDLDYLLEMLFSYMDIKSRSCVKCSRLLDRNAQFPIVRSRKQTKHPDGQISSQWQALHTACT